MFTYLIPIISTKNMLCIFKFCSFHIHVYKLKTNVLFYHTCSICIHLCLTGKGFIGCNHLIKWFSNLEGPRWLNELGSCRGPRWLNELGSWIT